MLYNSFLARSFSKHEQKKLGYGALVGCSLIAFSFCIMLKPYFLDGPLLACKSSILSILVKWGAVLLLKTK